MVLLLYLLYLLTYMYHLGIDPLAVLFTQIRSILAFYSINTSHGLKESNVSIATMTNGLPQSCLLCVPHIKETWHIALVFEEFLKALLYSQKALIAFSIFL